MCDSSPAVLTVRRQLKGRVTVSLEIRLAMLDAAKAKLIALAMDPAAAPDDAAALAAADAVFDEIRAACKCKSTRGADIIAAALEARKGAA